MSDDRTGEVTPAPESGEPGDPVTGGPDLARAALRRAKLEARARGLATARAPRRQRPARAPRDGDARDPQPFGAAIRQLMADRGWEQTERVASVMGRWAAIVGADVAAHCRPEALDDGILVIVAESTAWATQLRLLQRTLLERIGADIGDGVVRQLRVHGPTAPDWRRGPRRVVGRGPRDTYG